MKTKRRLTARELDQLSITELQALLASPQHYAHTATRNYGEDDPVREPGRLVYRCKSECPASLKYDHPSAAQLKMSKGVALQAAGAANFVSCVACGREGPPSLREWRAVVDWNYVNAREGRGDLDNFPFFNLAGLPAAEKLERLESIRYDLFVRRTLERKRKEAGEDVGGRFLAKLDAYRGWANVALALVKQGMDEKAPPNIVQGR